MIVSSILNHVHVSIDAGVESTNAVLHVYIISSFIIDVNTKVNKKGLLISEEPFYYVLTAKFNLR